MAGRFMRKGTTKFWFVPAIASGTLAPTVAEVNAGVNITTDVATVGGFSFANSPIKTPDMDTTFTKEIGGEDVAEDSSMDMYERDNSTTIHDALQKGDTGYMVIFYKGYAGASPAAADKVDVWPCSVTSNSRLYTADNQAAMYRVKFSITDEPAEALSVLA